jgi:hypothetical protein
MTRQLTGGIGQASMRAKVAAAPQLGRTRR